MPKSLECGGGDNSLIMRLPKEKIIFVVDFLPLAGTQFRIMADTYLPEQDDSMKKILAMDWDMLIPGHPGTGGRPVNGAQLGRSGTIAAAFISSRLKAAPNDRQISSGAPNDISKPSVVLSVTIRARQSATRSRSQSPSGKTKRAVSLPSRAFTAFVSKPGKVIVSAPT